MLKDVVSWLNYAWFDEVALVIFATCFVAIVVWSLTLRKETVDRFGSIPLTDEVVDPRDPKSITIPRNSTTPNTPS